MQDHELYRRILGIESPWRVEKVELKLECGEVHVHLSHEDVKQLPCPECGCGCRLYDHQPERQWRHLNTCQYQTILHAEPPRSECGEHGVRVVKLPWAEAGNRFTALFEGLAIEWLKASSQSAVAKLLRLSWDWSARQIPYQFVSLHLVQNLPGTPLAAAPPLWCDRLNL